jgi:hypothetical protein
MDQYRVKSGQSLFDVSIQLYGSTEFVLQLVQDNPQLVEGVNSNLESNTLLNYTKQNTTLTNFLDVNTLNLATTEPRTIPGASYSNDYSEDYDN